MVEDTTTHIKNCYRRQNELSYCLEGKNDNDNFICDKCVNNSEKNENICSCNSDSFSVDTNLCYKCNDIKYGIPGCDISKGCYFDSSTYQITFLQRRIFRVHWRSMLIMFRSICKLWQMSL